MSIDLKFPKAVYVGSYQHHHEGIVPRSLISPEQAVHTERLGCTYTRRRTPHPYLCPACGDALFRMGGRKYHSKRAYFGHGSGGSCEAYNTMSDALAYHKQQEALRAFDHAIWTGACPDAHEGFEPRGLISADAAHYTADLRHGFGLPAGEHAYRCPDARCGRPVYKAGHEHHGNQVPHFRHVGDDEACAPGGKETKIHHLLKNSIARVLNARDGINASVETVLHDGSRIVPDVSVTLEDGQVVYVEVVVFHRPEFSVVPVLAPNLIVVRAIDFEFEWIHQTDDVAIAVADAVERLHAALTATACGTVQPSDVVSESWSKWGRGFRRDGFAVPQFLDVIGHGSFSTVTKFGIVGHQMVEEKIGERTIERPIEEVVTRKTPIVEMGMVPTRVRYPMGAKKVTEPGTLRQKTETIYGTKEVLVQKRHTYFRIEKKKEVVGMEIDVEDVMGMVERPVEDDLAYQRFTLGNTAVFDVLGDGVPAEAFSLDDVDLHLERDEVEVLVQRAVMVHVNRTLASELEHRLATYEAAGEEE